MKYLTKITAAMEIIVLLSVIIFSPLLDVNTAQAVGGTQIRQEVNIIDAYYYAPSGSYATSSEIVGITDQNYSNPAYYFEVVASTTAGTTASVALVDNLTGATITTVSVTGGNVYTRYRSAQFLPSASTTVEYRARLNNEAIGKGIIAARVVVLQNTTSLTNTQTQIEIGSNETFSGTATTTFTSPKYWYYDSSKWDNSPAFYAEADYNVINGVASSTTYSAVGTFFIQLPGGTASTSIGLWGGGGAGGASTVTTGGDGGTGGQFASSTRPAYLNSQSPVVLTLGLQALGGAGAGSNGGDATWDGGVVWAKGGIGGQANGTASTSASLTGCIGTICFAGGSGGKGTAVYGAGGGGGAGTTGSGGSATGAGVNGSGTAVGGGAGGTKQTANLAGVAGTAAGGGGGGAFRTSGGTKNGGNGAIGQAIIMDYMATTTIALQKDDGQFANWTDVTYITTAATVHAGVPARVRSAAFTPSNGKHYRIVLQKGDTRTVVAVYNAKIIVDQPYFFDKFNDASLDLVKWPASFGTAGIVSSQLKDTVNALSANYSGIDSTAGATNLTGRDLSIEVVDIGNMALPGYQAFPLQVFSDANNQLKFYANLGTIIARKKVGGIETDFGTGQVYNATTHKYLRIRESGGNTFMEYSSDRVTWNVLASGANPIGVTGLQIEITAGDFNTTEAASAMIVDNLNITPITLAEPQYLLANTRYAAGTAVQNYITRYDPADWSTTNNYLHAVNAADNSTSAAGLYNAGTLLTNSTVTSPDNYATSTLGVCMSVAAADLDTKATVNNNDIYGDSIIVQVGVSSTAGSCTAASVTFGQPIVGVRLQTSVRYSTSVR